MYPVDDEDGNSGSGNGNSSSNFAEDTRKKGEPMSNIEWISRFPYFKASMNHEFSCFKACINFMKSIFCNQQIKGKEGIKFVSSYLSSRIKFVLSHVFRWRSCREQDWHSSDKTRYATDHTGFLFRSFLDFWRCNCFPHLKCFKKYSSFIPYLE